MTPDWPMSSVASLQSSGVLLVEDGNHGEYRPRPNEFADEGVAFIRAADMADGRVLFDRASKIDATAMARIRKGIGKPGDVLLSHKGTVGKVAMAPIPCPAFVCSPQTTFWRTLDESSLSRGYLFALLRSPYFQAQLSTRSGETDMAAYVSLTSQRGLEIPVPPIDQQRAIAHILGTLDDEIELNRRMNETLEAMARALFKSWFVDFDPVRAKMEGRWRPGESLPGLPAHLYDLFPDRLVDSEWGEIPEGWATCAIGSLATIDKSGIKPADWPDETFDHYSIPAFDAGQSPAREQGATIKSSKFLVHPESVLLSKLNPRIPRVWIPRSESALRAICSTEFLVCLAEEPATRNYLFGLFTSDAFTREFESLATGTSGSHQRARPSAFLAMETLKPDPDTIQQFDSLTNHLITRCEVTAVESETLAALRDALLPKLVSGELRIPDAERLVEDVA